MVQAWQVMSQIGFCIDSNHIVCSSASLEHMMTLHVLSGVLVDGHHEEPQVIADGHQKHEDDLHGQLLRSFTLHAGCHCQGLHQASRGCTGLLDVQMQKMKNVDIAYNGMRHINA